MDAETLRRVRRFNRVVTQRVGALYDQFLARDRPLGGARVLWEIGPAGADVRELRARLDLDSGYLSRLLRSLERDGLVGVETSDADRRVRTARLTAAGLAERAELDRRSDDAAAALLAPLGEAQQARLVAAMTEVERLLVASMVELVPTDPRHPHARRAAELYYEVLGQRFPEGFELGRSLPASDDDLTPPAGVLLVATLHGEPVGCGAVVFRADGTAHVKRMWVADEVRGLGLGRRLLAALEGAAAARGAAVVRLETHRALTEAITLYRSAGYREVEPFNAERYAHHWFEKELPATP
jgi:DNA-binding MarR family transcriptional regulator/GNAT superfamily N-acetyltransferase